MSAISAFRDEADQSQFVQDFDGGRVWADYSISDGVHLILHVEAELQLRGSGASGNFMLHLAEFARTNSLRLKPICGYAVVWFKRHPDYADVLA